MADNSAYVALGKMIFLQACKDMLGLDGVSTSTQREAEHWLRTDPKADLFAGGEGCGVAAANSIQSDPEGVKQRLFCAYQAIRADNN